MFTRPYILGLLPQETGWAVRTLTKAPREASARVLLLRPALVAGIVGAAGWVEPG